MHALLSLTHAHTRAHAHTQIFAVGPCSRFRIKCPDKEQVTI
jgi:hypothetical protein